MALYQPTERKIKSIPAEIGTEGYRKRNSMHRVVYKEYEELTSIRLAER